MRSSLTIILLICSIFLLSNSSFINGQLGSSFEKNGICSKANYTLNPSDSSKIIVTNSEYINGQYSQAIGEAYCPHPEQDPAKLLVSFGHQPFAGPYWIVDTDYKTYSMVFSCVNILGVYHID